VEGPTANLYFFTQWDMREVDAEASEAVVASMNTPAGWILFSSESSQDCTSADSLCTHLWVSPEVDFDDQMPASAPEQGRFVHQYEVGSSNARSLMVTITSWLPSELPLDDEGPGSILAWVNHDSAYSESFDLGELYESRYYLVPLYQSSSAVCQSEESKEVYFEQAPGDWQLPYTFTLENYCYLIKYQPQSISLTGVPAGVTVGTWYVRADEGIHRNASVVIEDLKTPAGWMFLEITNNDPRCALGLPTAECFDSLGWWVSSDVNISFAVTDYRGNPI
jgi:hypothetical protein